MIWIFECWNVTCKIFIELDGIFPGEANQNEKKKQKTWISKK